MVFAGNSLSFTHEAGGFGVEFSALDALGAVNDHEDLVKVSHAKEWMEARKVKYAWRD